MKKRVISVLMILVLCVFSHPWTAYAAMRDNSLEYERTRLEYVDSIMRELNELVAVDVVEKSNEGKFYSDNISYGLKKNEETVESQKTMLYFLARFKRI